MQWTRGIGLVLGLALGAVATAEDSIVFYEAQSWIQTQIGKATFDNLKTYDPLFDYQEAGLRVSTHDFQFGSGHYYANGGVNEQYLINRVDAEDFEVLEMITETGFASAMRYWWFQVFLDTKLVGEWDVDLMDGGAWELVGMRGKFDEVWVGAYYDEATRNQHSWANQNAAKLDNVAYGTVISKACPGDFDCDGDRDFDDIDPFVEALNTGQCKCPEFGNCDPNGDGKIDFDDIDPFIPLIGVPCP